MGERLQLSPTALRLYQECPQKFSFSSQPELSELKKLTDYPRLCGSEVHRHIAQLHKPTKDNRPFYFKSKRSAIGSWCNRWKRAVEGALANSTLLFASQEETERYKKIGVGCIGNYWEANFGQPRPLEIETRHSVRLPNGLDLLGIFDQVRRPPLEWVAAHRPEIVENGRLKDGYDQAIIMDFKTQYSSFDPEKFSPEEQIRLQFSLHESLQPTVYTFLYQGVHGKKPVGFVLCHLRSGKTFFTYREEEDYQVLFEIIDHVVENSEAQSFPKHVTDYCARCEFLRPCRGERPFLISPSEGFPGTEEPRELVFVESGVTINPVRQLNLGIKAERKKKDKPPEIPKTPIPIVLRNLP